VIIRQQYRPWKAAVIAAVLLLLLFPVKSGGGYAPDGMPVPVPTQFALFKKILKFDRNLKTRSGNGVVAGIAFQGGYRPSLNAKEQAAGILADNSFTIESLSVSVQELDLGRIQDVEKELRLRKITLLYIAPLQAYPLADIIRATRNLHILTLTGVSSYVQEGVSVGLDTEIDDRPKILINRKSSLLEGADFQANLLKLAKIYE
jgi:hypothetical protein